MRAAEERRRKEKKRTKKKRKKVKENELFPAKFFEFFLVLAIGGGSDPKSSPSAPFLSLQTFEFIMEKFFNVGLRSAKENNKKVKKKIKKIMKKIPRKISTTVYFHFCPSSNIFLNFL